MSKLVALTRRVVREPLVHFTLIGLLLLGADRMANRPAPEAKVIVMGAEVRADLIRVFTERNGRPPNNDEEKALSAQWLEDEVLFREGVALGLDRDDLLIRNHVIEKMRFLLGNTSTVREPSEAELKRFFAANAKKYQGSTRYSFDHVEVPSGSKAEAQRRLERLKAGAAPSEFGEDYRAYQARSARNVIAIFGPELSDELFSSESDVWRSFHAGAELHLFRLRESGAGAPPSFDQLRNDLASEWKREEQHAQSRSRLESMRKGYQVSKDDS